MPVAPASPPRSPGACHEAGAAPACGSGSIDAASLIRSGAFQKINSPRRGGSPGASAPWSLILALIGFVGLCLLVGAADAAITSRSLRTWYLTLTQPPGTPPGWVFAPVWTVLYVMIGVSGWLVWRRVGAAAPLRLWGWQLLANAMWPPAFFGFRSTACGVLVIVAELALVGLTLVRFFPVDRIAAALLVPYAAWTLYASYLALGFWWLN